MANRTGGAGSVAPTPSALGTLWPVRLGDASVVGGFWAERLRLNRERTIPHGFAELDRVGNFHDLRLAAGASGSYQALGLMFGAPFPFLDSDVYKWLEAVGWELGRGGDPELERAADVAIDLVAKAQRPDGYINSFVQVLAPGREYTDLAWGHELYCIGHLIQAAVAWQRAVGDDRLLQIAIRAAESVERELGPGGREAIDGHPEIEMALVELYRTTGERRHLEAAARFVERRGHGLLVPDRYTAAYWQDHLPVREAPSAAGHAVRQLYLDCGAVDVATELGDHQLLEAVRRRWGDMIATRMYLTGGLGSRHRDESFGDPYELPPDRAYAETCAAIADVMLAWRLLLATGEPLAGDIIERTLLNAVLPALGADGVSFFYVNPLQRRTDRVAADAGTGERRSWYPCSCCPPNLMRTLSSWEQLLATTDGSGIQVHQLADADLRLDTAAGLVRLEMRTGYPWDGRVRLRVVETPAAPWTLTIRRPGWAGAGQITWPTAGSDGSRAHAGQGPGTGVSGPFVRSGPWTAGDEIVLDLPVAPRVVEPHPRIDAIRGTVAIERGPLVYALESADLPGGVVLEDVALDRGGALAAEARDDLGAGVIGVTATGRRLPKPEAVWPYAPVGPAGPDAPDDRPLALRTIPYLAWANRGPGGMRVWIPTRTGRSSP